MRSNLKTNLFFGAVLVATIASAPVGCNRTEKRARETSTMLSPPAANPR